MGQQEKMFNLVEDFYRSGKSQKDFCLEQGLKTSTFSYWIKKKRKSSESGGTFLKIETSAPVSEEIVEIFYPNGVRLRTTQKDFSVISALIRLY
jgi:transposase-like protein